MAQLLQECYDLLETGEAPELQDRANKAARVFQNEQDLKGYAESMSLVVEALKIQEQRREAKELAKSMLQECREAENAWAEGMSQMTIAELYSQRMGSHGREVAARSATAAIEIFRSEQDKMMLGRALLARCRVHFAEIDKNYSKTEFREREALAAVEAVDEALQIFKELGNKRHQAKAYSCLAHVRCFGDLVEDWVEPGQASLEIHRELGLDHMEAYDLYMMAYWYHMKEDWGEVLSYAKQSMAMFKDQRHKKGFIAACLQWIYKAHMQKSEQEEALQAIKDNLAWFADNEDKHGQAACHDLLVDLYLEDEDPDEALVAADKALELVRSLGDRRWESSILEGVANVHMSKKSKEGKDKAVNAIQQSLKVFQKLRDMKGEGNLYHTLAHIFMSKEKYKEALQAAQKERSCYKRANQEELEATALMTIYQVHACRRKPGQAIKAASEAIKIFQNIEDRAKETSALIALSSAYIMDNKRSKALEVCKSALKVSREIGDRELEEHALSVLQQIEKPQAADTVPGAEVPVETATAMPTESVPAQESAISFLDAETVTQKVVEVAKSVVILEGDEEDVSLDTPLMDLGMDSLSSVGFRNSLMKEFSGLALPASMMFNFPTVRLISDEIIEVSKTKPVSLH